MFRHSHPGTGRGLSQAVFTHSQTCSCWSDQLMLLNHPDLCVLTSPVAFLHPWLFSSCLTSQPEEFHAVERAGSHAAGQPPPHSHVADWVSVCGISLESPPHSVPGRKKLPPHIGTAVGNVSHVLHSLYPHGAFPVSHLCSRDGGALVWADQDMAESSTPSTAPGSVRSTRKGALQVPPAWTVSFLQSSLYVEIADVSFLAAITLAVHTKTLFKRQGSVPAIPVCAPTSFFCSVFPSNVSA